MVATSLHFVALEGQTRWPLESCQLTVVVFAPSSIASLARVEHTMQVLFVVLRDEGRRHLLKAVPKHFRSRMRLALDSRLPWALVLALQQNAQMQDHYPVRCLFFGSCCFTLWVINGVPGQRGGEGQMPPVRRACSSFLLTISA